MPYPPLIDQYEDPLQDWWVQHPYYPVPGSSFGRWGSSDEEREADPYLFYRHDYQDSMEVVAAAGVLFTRMFKGNHLLGVGKSPSWILRAAQHALAAQEKEDATKADVIPFSGKFFEHPWDLQSCAEESLSLPIENIFYNDGFDSQKSISAATLGAYTDYLAKMGLTPKQIVGRFQETGQRLCCFDYWESGHGFCSFIFLMSYIAKQQECFDDFFKAFLPVSLMRDWKSGVFDTRSFSPEQIAAVEEELRKTGQSKMADRMFRFGITGLSTARPIMLEQYLDQNVLGALAEDFYRFVPEYRFASYEKLPENALIPEGKYLGVDLGQLDHRLQSSVKAVLANTELMALIDHEAAAVQKHIARMFKWREMLFDYQERQSTTKKRAANKKSPGKKGAAKPHSKALDAGQNTKSIAG